MSFHGLTNCKNISVAFMFKQAVCVCVVVAYVNMHTPEFPINPRFMVMAGATKKKKKKESISFFLNKSF